MEGLVIPPGTIKNGDERTAARPDLQFTTQEPEQPMLSADMPRAETTPLYRGLTLDTQDFLRGTPGHSIDYDSGPRPIVFRDPSLEDALFEDTQEPYLRREPVGSPSRPGPNRELTTDPDLAGHILDYLESGSGIGTHWSADREIGDAFGRPGSDTNNHFPVRLKSEWGGQDEDHDRNHTAGEWDEDEITRLPGSQVNLTGLETLIPGEDEWRSYDFPGGEIRRAQRVAMPAPTPESITYNYQDYFDSDPMVMTRTGADEDWSSVIPGYDEDWSSVHLDLSPEELLSYGKDDNTWDKESLPTLAEDIAQNGVREPVILGSSGTHALLDDGHHRARAAQMAGINSVPVHLEYDRWLGDAEEEEGGGKPLGEGLRAWLQQRGGRNHERVSDLK